MFIPLHDANSLKHIKMQYVTIGLIVFDAVIYLFTVLHGQGFAEATAVSLGYIPAVAFDHAELPPQLELVPESFTYLTYAFLHSDIFHLGGNMLFLWVFGDNVEDALGHIRFLVFYLLCAAGGALLHGLVVPNSQMPLIGASGAIAGIVTAYLVLHPRVKIWVLAFGRIPLRIPAWIAILAWILFQFGMMLFGDEEQISWACHVGGILTGAALVLILKRRGVPVLDREIVTPRSVAVDQTSAVEPLPAVPLPRWGRR
jgi:membrane associated rhomboid family serine protease